MHRLFHSRSLHIGIAGALILIALLVLASTLKNAGPGWTTASVSRGAVLHLVSVSGIVEASNAAELAFPITGKVSEVFVDEGDQVTKGQALITLENAGLLAERQSAYAALLKAEAERDELIRGPREEARTVTNTAVEIATEDLERVIAEENEKVESARRTLLSDDLEALPVRQNNDDVPPTVSGTYACAEEGHYRFSTFPSSAQSGYSYQLSGLESGTFTAYSESPAPLGTCGLRIQFATGETYGTQEWTIDIPNTRSSSYITNLNAYNLALQQRDNRVRAAEQALDLALREQTLENAAPREEALQRANADVLAAQARLNAVDADIADRTLRAPFDGTITRVDALAGETVTAAPVVTVLASDTFELTARIPEIDITKVAVGQKARVVFDARQEEELLAEIVFISPLALEIDGVAYFEAHLQFENPPSWIRSGLNADIDIIVEDVREVLRIPNRFILREEGGASFVLIPSGADTTQKTEVAVGFEGNDGFVEITSGLREGDTVIAP